MSALRTFANPAADTIHAAINAAVSSDQLDVVARTLWQGYGQGAIGDNDAEFLQSCIDRRRPHGASTTLGHMKGIGRLAGRVGSHFTPRQRQRSPDRKASRERRRTLGSSAVMPPNLRSAYTEGQRAVLAIIAGEVKHHGTCDLPIDKIAALAGVCRTTVQTTLHEARRLGHIKITERPMPGRKHLPNVVEIVSPEWRTWIKRGPTAHRPIGSNSVKMASTTKNTDLRDHPLYADAARGEGQQGATRGVPWARSGPSPTPEQQHHAF